MRRLFNTDAVMPSCKSTLPMRSPAGSAPLTLTYRSFSCSCSWSKLLALHHLDGPHSWVLHDRSLDATPHLAHGSKKTFRLVYALELAIDDRVVWIVNRPEDPVAAYA